MSEKNLPPAEEYPGYFPPTTSFWSRTKVAIACAIGGLLIGIFIGFGGSGAETGDEQKPSSDAVTQADIDEATAAVEADSEVALATAEKAEAKAVAQTARKAQRALRAALKQAEARHRKALTTAVAKAVAAERRKADARVAAASAASSAPAASGVGVVGQTPASTTATRRSQLGTGRTSRDRTLSTTGMTTQTTTVPSASSAMPGFFSVKLAAGVRLSASPRGLRVHAGPRVGRVHVGGGGAGVSTGAGPFTYYTSGSGARSRTHAYCTGPTSAQIALFDKAQQAQQIVETLQAIEGIHRQTFAPAVRPTAPLPQLPYTFLGLVQQTEREALQGVGRFQRSARRAARGRARAEADRRARQLLSDAYGEQRRVQSRYDEWWGALLANDSTVVFGALAQAFEDNGAPAAPVDVAGDHASIVTLVPPIEVVPDRHPATTAAGNLSLRKATKTMRAGWHRQVVAGEVLASAKAALAAAPGIECVTVVALCGDSPDPHMGTGMQPVLATRLSRSDLDAVQWAATDAWSIMQATGRDTRAKVKGVAQELQPIDLSAEPDLELLTKAVALEDPGDSGFGRGG